MQRGERCGPFIALVFGLSIPFWAAGALTRQQLLPGLPVSALAFACPALAAMILRYKRRGISGVITLLRQSCDWRRIPTWVWYIPIVGLRPAVDVVTYGVMRIAGLPLPSFRFSILAATAMVAAFFVAALGEELGWSGYAIDAMKARWGVLKASVLLGVVWAAVHWVPLLEAQRSLSWIAWWSLGTVASRVLIVWVYDHTRRSVFAATVVHASGNVSWQLFPIQGSHWDPRINAIVAVIAAAVLSMWSARPRNPLGLADRE